MNIFHLLVAVTEVVTSCTHKEKVSVRIGKYGQENQPYNTPRPYYLIRLYRWLCTAPAISPPLTDEFNEHMLSD